MGPRLPQPSIQSGQRFIWFLWPHTTPLFSHIALPAFKESINFSILAKYLPWCGARCVVLGPGWRVMTSLTPPPPVRSSARSTAPPPPRTQLIGRRRGARRGGCPQLRAAVRASLNTSAPRPVDGCPSAGAHRAQRRITAAAASIVTPTAAAASRDLAMTPG